MFLKQETDGDGKIGGHEGGRGAHNSSSERPKKENILDLGKYMDKAITVKFTGGREGISPFPPGEPFPLLSPHVPPASKTKAKPNNSTVTGTLKGYDALMNLVLDDVSEILRDDEGNTSSRPLGLVVARGTLLVLVSPMDGSEEIANPFVQAEE